MLKKLTNFILGNQDSTYQRVLEIIKLARKQNFTGLSISPKEQQQYINKDWLANDFQPHEIFWLDAPLTNLPPEIGQLNQLRTLSLGNNQLTTLPLEIGQLSQLNTFSLGHNQLTTLPPEIGQLNQLRTLWLDNNQLTDLPPEIGQLTNLQILYLYENQLTTLPPEIGQLTNLQILHLYRNQLTTLPSKIGQLANLQKLYLSENKLTTLPPEIGQLTNLQYFNLYGNELTTLPSEIGQLTNLQELYLNSNQLTAWIYPLEIGQLTNLWHLGIGYNQLTTLPLEICKLTNLTYLFLSNNQLTALPLEIRQLTNLQRLNLSANQLTALPTVLYQLPNLTHLALHDNPDLNIPLEIMGKNPRLTEDSDWQPNAQAILDYYYRAQRSDAKPLHEGKIILVGDGNVGKTTLVERLIHNRYDSAITTTQGIKIARWQFPNSEVIFNMWDFGGQELMYATHQFFLTNRSLYLVLCEGRTAGYDKLHHWLRLIRSFAPDAPVLVVENKCDQPEWESELDKDDLREYFKVADFAKISAKSGVGCAELIEKIRAHMATLRINDPIPAQYLAVKRELEALQLNRRFLDYQDYAAICIQHGVKKPEQQQQLIELLHNLGTVIYYANHPRLCQIGILNPQWVTDGVYAIVTSPALKQQKGQATIEDMQALLIAKGYAPETHWIILDTMREFKICFDFEGYANQRFLLPNLLATESVPAPFPPRPSPRKLEIRYEYDQWSESLMAYFITRVNRAIHQQHYWKFGVHLVKDTTYATVKTASLKKSLNVEVYLDPSNEQPGRVFLQELRQILAEIHHQLRGITVTESRLYQGKWKIYDDQANPLELQRHFGDKSPHELKEAWREQSLEGYTKYIEGLFTEQNYQEILQDGDKHYQAKRYSFARVAFMKVHESVKKWRGRWWLDNDKQKALSHNIADMYKKLVYCYIVETQYDKAFQYAAVSKGQYFIMQLAGAADFATSWLKQSQACKPPAEKWDNFVTAIQQEIGAGSARWQFADVLKLAADLRNDITTCENSHQRLTLEDVENDLWDIIFSISPTLSATMSVPEINSTQAQTLANTLQATLVEFYRHVDGWGAFVIEPGISNLALRFQNLPALTDTLLTRLADWRNQLSNWQIGHSEWRLQRLEELYQAAIAPLNLAGGDRLIIAPFQELHLLPLSAARHPHTKRYLLEDYTLSFVPSLTALHVLCREHDPSTVGQFKKLLAIAFPGPNNDLTVQEEAQAIIAQLQEMGLEARPLAQTQPTIQWLVDNVAGHDAVHFGCHGYFDTGNSEAKDKKPAGLLLQDGYLTVSEILTLNLKHVQLATLAACLSGQMDLRAGEEHVGLLQAMLTAGARTIAASLWSVDDTATSALFEAFYFRMAQLNSPSQAMREAMNLVRAQSGWAHPYFWVAFQVNGLPTVSHQTSAPIWPTNLTHRLNNYVERSTVAVRQRGENMKNDKIIESAELLLKDLAEAGKSEELLSLSSELACKQFEATEVGIAEALLEIAQANPNLKLFINASSLTGMAREVTKQQNESSKGASPVQESTVQAGNIVPGEEVASQAHATLNATYTPAPQTSLFQSLVGNIMGKLGIK